MQPWSNRTDMQEAEEASARARARIVELERELEEITKKALMASSKSLKSAKQMAYQASMEAEAEAKAASAAEKKRETAVVTKGTSETTAGKGPKRKKVKRGVFLDEKK